MIRPPPSTTACCARVSNPSSSAARSAVDISRLRAVYETRSVNPTARRDVALGCVGRQPLGEAASRCRRQT